MSVHGVKNMVEPENSCQWPSGLAGRRESGHSSQLMAGFKQF